MAKMFIAGEAADSVTGQTYEVRNPANGELVAGIEGQEGEQGGRCGDRGRHEERTRLNSRPQAGQPG